MVGLRGFLALSGMAILAGCASHDSHVSLNSYQGVPGVQAASPVAASPAYRINPVDELRIDVFGEPDLSFRDLPVSPNGTISLPLVGQIRAEGRTTQELAQALKAALNTYLREPQVAVNVTKFVSQKVTVEGAVRAPGVFQTPGQISLMEAIALGQGLDDASKESEILVFRRQGDQRFVARFDLGMIQNGAAVDPTILPGDVVVVGYSAGRRLFKDSLAVLPIAVGVFIALIR
jgi:polysaccharide export outer membrane protein